jgi:hypothetical protein
MCVSERNNTVREIAAALAALRPPGTFLFTFVLIDRISSARINSNNLFQPASPLSSSRIRAFVEILTSWQHTLNYSSPQILQIQTFF